MKSLMLHVGNDDGFDGRLQVALDITRRFGAHLNMVQPCLAHRRAGGRSHRLQSRLITPSTPTTTHSRTTMRLRPTTAASERAGRDHSNDVGMSRAGTMSAAFHASSPRIWRPVASPVHSSTPATTRHAGMWTPHSRDSESAPVTTTSSAANKPCCARTRERARCGPSPSGEKPALGPSGPGALR